jgi:hypothetical protein
MSAEQYFHIVGVFGSSMRQILAECVKFQRQQMVQAWHARLHLAEVPLFRRVPHLSEGMVVHKHQVEAVTGWLSELRERPGLAEQLHPARQRALEPCSAVSPPDHEINVESGARIPMRSHRPTTNYQEAE